MSIPYQQLADAGVDVAGIVTEDFLNKFSIAHHRSLPNLYKGKIVRNDFGPILEISYNVTDPIAFDLNPIDSKSFKPIWRKHLEIKGAALPDIFDQVAAPENVKLTSKKVNFGLAVLDPDNGNVMIKVDFLWDLEARCAISLNSTGSGAVLRLEPIKVEFTKSKNLLLKEIKEKLLQHGGKDVESKARAFSLLDDEWCLKVEQLLLFLFNGILSAQMSNFIRAWQLPNAIEITDGFQLSPNFLLIAANQMIVGGQVEGHRTGVAELQRTLDVVFDEYNERVAEEFEGLDDDGIRAWVPETSPSIQWLKEQRYGIETETRGMLREHESRIKSLSESVTINPNLSLLFNSDPIDLIAKKYLGIQKFGGDSVGIDHLVKAQVGWWFRVDNPSGRVVPRGIQMTATPNLGGSLEICHFNFDPKHFGSWDCHGIAVNLAFKNFQVNAFPTFESAGIYVRILFDSNGISLSFSGLPGWINDLIGWITAKLTEPIIDLIGAILSLFKFRIAQYPRYFPGTSLEWTHQFNTVPDNAGPYLVVSAAIDFK
jgi:hypothetical protein